MRALCALGLAACGSSSTAPPPSPCGGFGTVLGEQPLPGGIPGQHDLEIRGDTVLAVLEVVGTGTGLYTFDHQLSLISGPLPVTPESNYGISYDAVDDLFYLYQVASPTSSIRTYAGATLQLATGPTTTTHNTAAGFVDSAGHLHVILRTEPGFVEYDSTLHEIATWGTEGTGGEAAEIDRTRNLAWHVSPSAATSFDLSQPARPIVRTIAMPSGFHPVFSAIDDNGTLYAGQQADATTYAFREDGTVLGHFALAGETMGSLSYDATTGQLVVGVVPQDFTSTAKFICPYP